MLAAQYFSRAGFVDSLFGTAAMGRLRGRAPGDLDTPPLLFGPEDGLVRKDGVRGPWD